MRVNHWAVGLGIAAATVGACVDGDLAPRGWRGAAGERPARSLIVMRGADATDLDPACLVDFESREVAAQLYQGLVQFDPASAEVRPALAASWRADPTLRRWTFELAPGRRFHDGTAVDAAAVVASFARQLDPRAPGHRDGCGAGNPALANITTVRAVDARTVEFSLAAPSATFIDALVVPAAYVVSPTALQRGAATLATAPDGTGPYRLAAWIPGQRLVLEAAPTAASPVPWFARVTFEVERDPRQRLVALESGAADLAVGVVPDDQAYVTLHPGLQLHVIATDGIAYLAMNQLRPPLDDARLRRAIAHAVNRAGLVARAYDGRGVLADAALPTSSWAYHAPTTSYAYDPARAEALVREVGSELDGLPTLRLLVAVEPRPLLAEPELVGRAIAANLAAVGLTVEVTALPGSELRRAAAAGEHDLVVFGGIPESNDPGALLGQLFDSRNSEPGDASNLSFFRDPIVDGLLDRAQQRDTLAMRRELYAEVQDRVAAAAAWVPLAHPALVYAARADIAALPSGGRGVIAYAELRPAGSTP